MGTNKNKNSIFTWDFGKYKNKITHSDNYLPEFEIQASFIKFSRFAREGYQFQDITHLAFTFPPYAKTRIQEQAIQWILLQKLRKKLYKIQYHKY